MSETERLPRGLERHSLAELPPGVAQVLYERDQLLWLKLDSSQRSSCAEFSIDAVKSQFATKPGSTKGKGPSSSLAWVNKRQSF